MFGWKKPQEPSASELHKKCVTAVTLAQTKVDKLSPALDAPNIDPLAGTTFDFRRDFRGYGRDQPNPKWPNDAKIAICFVINYEEGSEKSVQNGDYEAESRLWEQSDRYPRMGQRDLQVESDYEYGSRVGIWRLLNLFEEMNMKITASCCGQALERNREVARALVDGGHQIESHCYRFIDYHDMEPELEREYIRRQLRSLKDTTGKTPAGWHYGRLSPKSKGLLYSVLREEKIQLLYQSDCYNDDLPYWVDVPAEDKLEEKERRGMLMIPSSYELNDVRFTIDSGAYGSANAFTDYLMRAFRTLNEEGQKGRGRLMTVHLHPRVSGKPGRFDAVKEFVEYVSKQEGVLVTTRKEIAMHIRQNFPYEKRRRGGRDDDEMQY